MREPLLVALAGLFLALLVFRFVRGVVVGRRISRSRACSSDPRSDPDLVALVEEGSKPGRAREVIREIERRALGRETRAEAASHHCAAGEVSLAGLKRPGLAVGFYLRALHDDPTCVEALDRLQEILTAQKRLRRLEWTCWEVLGRLSEAEVGSAAWVRCWSVLAGVYASSPRLVRRADAIRKMLSAEVLDAASDDGEEPPAPLPRAIS